MKNPLVLNKKASFFVILFNTVSLLLFIGSIVYLIMEWSSLPGQIPAHYNAVGEVDRWGSKGELLILPILGAVIWVSTTIVEKFPHLYNYRFNHSIKEVNQQQYNNSRIAINLLKNEVIVIFAFLTWNDLQVAKDVNSYLNFWSIFCVILILLITVIFFIVRSLRINKSHK